MDEFIRLNSGLQILIILLVVFILFFIAKSFWERKAEKTNDFSNDIKIEKVEVKQKEKDLIEVSVIIDKESINPNIQGKENNAPLSINKEGTPQSYDIFVNSINPATSDQIPSPINQWIVFLLFILISFGLSGLVFSILINMFEKRKEKWENGDINYKFQKDFILIIGGHRMINQLCVELLNPMNPKMGKNFVIVIQTRRKAIEVRKELESRVGKKFAKRIFIYNGDRTSDDDLSALYPEYASQIFLVGEDNSLDGSSHDTLSLECLDIIDTIIYQSPIGNKNWEPIYFRNRSSVRCHLMLEHENTTKALKHYGRALKSGLDLIIFNFYENWATQVMLNHNTMAIIEESDKGIKLTEPKSEIIYPSLLGKNPEVFIESEKKVHIIIVGMSKMGTMFASTAAELCHFPNFFTNVKHPRTLITFIDKDADIEMDNFKERNPFLCELARWRYVDAKDYMTSNHITQGNIYQSEFQGIDPLNKIGQESIFVGNGVDPNFMDIDWEFIKGNTAQPPIQKYLQEVALDKESVTTIAVCIPKSNDAASSAMFMPEEIYDSENITQILVLQQSSSAFIRTISNDLEIKTGFINKSREFLRINRYEKLRSFGMFDQLNYLNRLDLLPIIINYIYNQNIYDNNYDLKSNSEIQKLLDYLGEAIFHDLKQTIKEMKAIGVIREAIERYASLSSGYGISVHAQRDSNIYTAYSAIFKAAVFGIKPSEKPLNRLDPHQEEIINMLAETEHNRWDMEKIFGGYRPPKITDNAKYSKPYRDPDTQELLTEGQWFRETRNGQKRYMKFDQDLKLRKIHPDIRSYRRTNSDEGLTYGCQIYDIIIAMMTPVLLKLYKELSEWELRY